MACSSFRLQLVMQCLKHFPHLHLDATVSPITRSVLRVTLRITPQFEWKDRLHGTVERWWIWVEVSRNTPPHSPSAVHRFIQEP